MRVAFLLFITQLQDAAVTGARFKLASLPCDIFRNVRRRGDDWWRASRKHNVMAITEESILCLLLVDAGVPAYGL